MPPPTSAPGDSTEGSRLQASQDSASLLQPGVCLARAGELPPEGLGGLWFPTWPGPFGSVSSHPQPFLPGGICAGPLGPSLPRPL